MSAINHNDPRFRMNYVAGGNANARRDTLTKDGPLKLDAKHYFVAVLPSRYVPDIGNGEFGFTQHKTEFIILPGLDWQHDIMIHTSAAWVVNNTRPARLLAILQQHGKLDWTAVSSIKALAKRIKEACRTIPIADLAFGMADVVSFPLLAPPLVSIFHCISPRSMAMDGRMEAYIDYKSIIGGAYTLAERNDPTGHFSAAIAVLIDSAGATMVNPNVAVQANKIISWFKRTQPDTDDLRTYFEWDDYSDLSRRALPTPSERFIPLLVSAWNANEETGFANFKLAFPQACTGSEVVQLLDGLSARARLPPGLTAAYCQSLCSMLTGQPLNDIDTPDLRNASNSDRCAALGNILAATANSQGRATTFTDVAALIKYHDSVDYKSFVKKLEAENTAMPKYGNVIKICADNAAGRIWLAGGKDFAQILKSFAAAKQPHEQDAALASILAVDLNGDPLDRTLSLPGIAKLLIAGKFTPKQLDLWRDIIRKVIELRDGKAAVAREDNTGGGAFWADYSRLTIAEPICVATFAFVGHKGLHAGSYQSFHRGMISRARRIANLPDTLLKKPGLIRALIHIGCRTMELRAMADQTMHSEPPELAQIAVMFLDPQSDAARSLAVLDTDIKECEGRVRLRDVYGDVPDSDFARPSTLARQSQSRQYSSNAPADWASRPMNMAHNAAEPGASLNLWGVYLCDQGIIFGGKYLVSLARGNAADLARGSPCLGCVCYFHDVNRRVEWCNKQCAPSTLHRRPNGFSDADFVITNMYATNNDAPAAALSRDALAAQPSWRFVAGVDDKTAVMGGKGGSAMKQYNPAAASSSGQGSGRRGGKGGGKGAGGGGGKGAGKGGGKGIAKGSGKGGGKGKGQRNGRPQNFQGQY